MLLVCFFDLQQRPSRFCVTELAKRAGELKGKGVLVLAVQGSKVDRQELGTFVATNSLPFPVGMIAAEEEQAKFNWGVKSEPWLILTDKDHIVRAEGFALAELNERVSLCLQRANRSERKGPD